MVELQALMDLQVLNPAVLPTAIPNTHEAAIPGFVNTHWVDLPLPKKLTTFEGATLIVHRRVFVGHKDLTEQKPWVSYDAVKLVYDAVAELRWRYLSQIEQLLEHGFYYKHVTLRTRGARLYAYLKEHQE